MVGLSNQEIAARMNKTDSWISMVLNSPEAKEIQKRIEDGVIDTKVQIQTAIQAALPLLLKRKMHIALNSGNETVANKAIQECLEMGGHLAPRQVEIRRPDHIEEEFKNKSEEEIRREIRAHLELEHEEKPLLH
jgi:hypothetical protein